ncbi:SppA Periplasmic serine proteases (ClpP class) [Burkholderiales bacterium]
MNDQDQGRQDGAQTDRTAQTVMERLLFETLREQRAARRWAMARRATTLVLILVLASFIGSRWDDGPGPIGRHTALVSLSGVIEADGEVDALLVNDALRAAFESPDAAGVLLRMNSPGGSPVQSGIIYDEIRRLKALYPDKQVVAVVEDVCASGGYYVAAAADSIYVNQASLVGSIGVRLDGFGLTEAIRKMGIERRLYTAGSNKAMLDPFLPQDPKHQRATQQMLDDVHQQFISAVQAGRKDRLKADPDIFSGMVYTGTRSIELGLADGIGSVASVARDIFKAEEIVDYSFEPSVAERVAKRFGAAAGETVMRAMRAGGGGSSPIW